MTVRTALLRGMRSTVGRESTTFGFSILVTVVFGMLQSTEGTPSGLAVVLYAVGAVLSFSVLEGLLSQGFRRPMPQHHTHVLNLATSMNLVSVMAGLGAGFLVGALLRGLPAWALAPYAGGTVYLLVESLEATLAERIYARNGDPEAAEVED